MNDKARPNSGGRERYAAAAKRIKEAVKAGKITEVQGKERLAAYTGNNWAQAVATALEAVRLVKS